MRTPVKPRNESERLTLLYGCGVLDTDPEPAFDDVVRLASQICGVPIALVSLVDHDRQWFKARVGLPVAQTSRDHSFCAHAVASGSALVVHDTLEDPRFVDNPLVLGEPNIRFYVGIPLIVARGVVVGTLCVLDRVPRVLSGKQMEALEMLARQVTAELRRRRRLFAGWPDTSGQARRLPAKGVPFCDTVLGRYRIAEILGIGGMGVVVAAVDLASGEEVAIKFILPEAMQDEVVERFVAEAQSLLHIDSRHVTRVLDVGNLGNGAPFIVMERLDGVDLDELLDEALPAVEHVLGWMIEACRGVADIHAAGILHRDLKPANLFLVRRPDGTSIVKILDFGISKRRGADSSNATPLTGPLALLGSPHYMSPEQMTLGMDLDERTDVWSLGVVLYELLTNVRPFDADSPLEICARVLTAPPTPLAELRPGLAPEIHAIVACCLSQDRDDRYASIEALADALRAVQSRPVGGSARVGAGRASAWDDSLDTQRM